MSDVVFMDTETLGLSVDSPIWEFAAIRRHMDGAVVTSERALHLYINHDPERISPDLPESFVTDYQTRWKAAGDASLITQPDNAADLIVEFFADRPHVVGAVPNFDTERIAHQLLRPRGHVEPWHYHLIDVENLVAGFLAGRSMLMQPPWKSDDLSAAVGIDPELFERHTAMGDVRWAMAQWDAVINEGLA